MPYNGDMTWDDLKRDAERQGKAAFINTEAQIRGYDEWQSFRAGRTNTQIAMALGITKAAGTAQSGTATTIRLAASDSQDDDYYNNMVVRITKGTGVGQEKTITDYDSTTKDATVSAWTTNPDSTSEYAISGPEVAEMDSFWSAMKAGRDILHNIAVSQSDYAFSIRKFT